MTTTAQLLDELRTHSVRGINRRVDWMFDAAADEIERLSTELAEAQMQLSHTTVLSGTDNG